MRGVAASPQLLQALQSVVRLAHRIAVHNGTLHPKLLRTARRAAVRRATREGCAPGTPARGAETAHEIPKRGREKGEEERKNKAVSRKKRHYRWRAI